MRQGDWFKTSIRFLKTLYEVKANGLQLVLITFDSPQLGKQIKQNIKRFRILIQ